MKSVVGHPEDRPGPVPRARGVRHLRLRARQGVPGPARPRLPPDRAARSSRRTPRSRSRSRCSSIYAGTNGLDRHGAGRREVQRFETELLRVLQGTPRRRSSSTIRRRERCPTATSWTRASSCLPRGFDTGEGRLTHGRRPRACPAAADPQRPVHEEDHEGDGADRRLADRARPEPDRGQPAVPPGHGARSCGRRPRPIRRRPEAARGRPSRRRRVGIVAIVGDRGLAGAYNSGVLRATERLVGRALGRRRRR